MLALSCVDLICSQCERWQQGKLQKKAFTVNHKVPTVKVPTVRMDVETHTQYQLLSSYAGYLAQARCVSCSVVYQMAALEQLVMHFTANHKVPTVKVPTVRMDVETHTQYQLLSSYAGYLAQARCVSCSVVYQMRCVSICTRP